MNDGRRKNLLGVLIDAVDYESTLADILSAARSGRGIAVSALAVHGTMMGVLKGKFRHRLNRLDLVVPDGQPVRWALNWLHDTGLRDRVYGPTLTRMLLERCASEAVPVYLYGSDIQTLAKLVQALKAAQPKLIIAGFEPSRFGRIGDVEKREIARRIRASGAKITLAGLGCPRQEIWAHDFRALLDMPVVAVGAAFPFLAGSLPQAPKWMQELGLEWLFRLLTEPRRLWRRYLLLNPLYVALVVAQFCGLGFATDGPAPRTGVIDG
jgi:exopolysaccharide biosynthesis WecB/TagA/CpsF family protein